MGSKEIISEYCEMAFFHDLRELLKPAIGSIEAYDVQIGMIEPHQYDYETEVGDD